MLSAVIYDSQKQRGNKMWDLTTIKYMNSPEGQEAQKLEKIIDKMATHLSVSKSYERYGSVNFKYNGSLTEKQAVKVQQEYGYHPAGYGFYSLSVDDGVTTWNCSNCCD